LSGSGINDNKSIEGNNPGVSNTMSNSNIWLDIVINREKKVKITENHITE